MERYDYRHIRIESSEFDGFIYFHLDVGDIEYEYSVIFRLLLVYDRINKIFITSEDDHTEFLRKTYGL